MAMAQRSGTIGACVHRTTNRNGGGNQADDGHVLAEPVVQTNDIPGLHGRDHGRRRFSERQRPRWYRVHPMFRFSAELQLSRDRCPTPFTRHRQTTRRHNHGSLAPELVRQKVSRHRSDHRQDPIHSLGFDGAINHSYF